MYEHIYILNEEKTGMYITSTNKFCTVPCFPTFASLPIAL